MIAGLLVVRCSLSVFVLASCGRVAFEPLGDAATGDSARLCGDGVVGAGEQCDDGNEPGGDGCSATCQLEDQGPGGASCASPRTLHLVPIASTVFYGEASGTTVGGVDTLRSTCLPNIASPEAIYEIEVSTAGSLRIEVTGSSSDGGDALLFVRSGGGGCADSAGELACVDVGFVAEPEEVTLNVTPGTYYALVELLRNGSPATPGAIYSITAKLQP